MTSPIEWLITEDELEAADWQHSSWSPYLDVGAGVALGGPVLALFPTDWSQPSTFWPVLLYTTPVLTLMMVPVALLKHWERRTTFGRLHRLFALDATVVQPPPPGCEAAVPCDIYLPSGRGASGILYAGYFGLFFGSRSSRRRNGAGGSAPPGLGLLIGPPSTVVATVAGVRLSWLGRLLLRRRLVPGLLVKWGGGCHAFFHVPTPGVILERLQPYLDRARATWSQMPASGAPLHSDPPGMEDE